MRVLSTLVGVLASLVGVLSGLVRRRVGGGSAGVGVLFGSVFFVVVFFRGSGSFVSVGVLSRVVGVYVSSLVQVLSVFVDDLSQ